MEKPADEPRGSIHFDWTDSGDVQVRIEGQITPIHLFGASGICRVEAEKMMVQQQMEQANKGSGLTLARGMPPVS